MLYAFTNTNQSLNANDTVKFNNIGVRYGRSATLSAGSGVVSINTPGYYLVHFNADVAAAAANVTVQLQKDGVPVTGASATTSSTALTDIQNLSFTALVFVGSNCSCKCLENNLPATLTFVNSDAAASFTNAAVTITRVA